MTCVAVLGASGGVGRRIVAELLARGHEVVAQTREAARLAGLGPEVKVHAFDPRDGAGHVRLLGDADAAVFALGESRLGRTTLFSDATRALLAAMSRAGIRRLVAITGVGAGDTRGHGGMFYNRLIFPLFTARKYADKDRQEALILASGTDWTILRPAPFRETMPSGPLQAVTEVPPGLQLTGVTRDEVAAFVVDELEAPRHIRQKVFLGHE